MRTCIFCGERTGSREHIFPATLGGRRTNKGIYCARHNESFSRHAEVISKQLRAFNALLRVRPDHVDAAQPYHLHSSDGEAVIMFDGEVRRREAPTVHRPGLINTQIELGRPDGLRAVGYIALTFFAHFFKEAVRTQGLDEFKRFIEKDTENEFVWWERPEILDGLPTANPFTFGHTVCLSTPKGEGEILGVISLFQEITFGVRLGWGAFNAAQTTVVYIDPNADSTPSDIKEEHHLGTILALRRPEPLQAHLIQMADEGIAAAGVDRLIAKIKRWHFEKSVTPVLGLLNAARSLPPNERQDKVDAAVSQLAPWLYLIFNFLAIDFKERQDGQPQTKLIQEVLNQAATLDRSSRDKIATTEAYLGLAAGAVANQLEAILLAREINLDDMWRVLRTGHGASVVAASLYEIVITALARLATPP